MQTKAELRNTIEAQAQRIEELQESLHKLTKAFDTENERACKAEAEALAFSRKLGEEETRRREEREEAEARELESTRALAKRDMQTLSLQSSLEQAQAEAQAYKELYREAQARKERALIVARNRKAEALSLCKKLVQAEQAQAQAEAVADNIELRKAYFTLLCESEAQADTIRELRQELSETKCKALSDSLPF